MAVLVHDSVGAIRLIVEEELKAGSVVGGVHLKLHAPIVVPTPSSRNKYPKKLSVVSLGLARTYGGSGCPCQNGRAPNPLRSKELGQPLFLVYA